jgi:hypothetical protein
MSLSIVFPVDLAHMTVRTRRALAGRSFGLRVCSKRRFKQQISCATARNYDERPMAVFQRLLPVIPYGFGPRLQSRAFYLERAME